MLSELSVRHLESVLRSQDTAHYPFVLQKRHRDHYLGIIAKSIRSGNFEFCRFKKKSIRGFSAFRTQKLGDELILRCLTEGVRSSYKLKQSDRGAVISQVRELLAESIPKYILRLDLAAFYESVSRDTLLATLEAEGKVSLSCLTYLQQFFKALSTQLVTGLPRGLSLSSALSELYLKDLDKDIRRIDGVYYYARYVDDIIVFSTKESTILKESIRQILPVGMAFNEKKCRSFRVGCRCKPKCRHTPAPCSCAIKCTCKPEAARVHRLDFLGYEFTFDDVAPSSKLKRLDVAIGIANKKLLRLQTRIVRALLSHQSNANFDLLLYRLQFLSENQPIRSGLVKGNLKTGIYYNFPLITHPAALRQLDIFLRNQLWASKSSFGSKVHGSLSPLERAALRKLSFFSGHTAKRSRRMTSGILAAIKRCWKYD